MPIELSRCPFCGARGVKQYEPLVVDGLPRDVPYCGKCGRNYPVEKEDAEQLGRQESGR
jgi:uncharacterized protein with PIN domain